MWRILLDPRVIIGLVLVVLGIFAVSRINYLELRAERDRATIAQLEAEITHKGAVLQEIARIGAQREQEAREAVEEARRKARANEAEIARLRGAKAPAGVDACAAAAELLRDYRSRL